MIHFKKPGLAFILLFLIFYGCIKVAESPSAMPTSSAIRFYGSNYGNFLNSFEATADGGFMFGGYTFSSAGQEDQGFIQKTDDGGNVLWYKTYGGPAVDIFASVHTTSDGGYIAAGATNSYGNGSASERNDFFFDAYLLKADANGKLLWQKNFGGILDDRFFDVAETPDHGFIAVGIYNSNTYNCVYIVKTDHNGDSLWTKQVFANSTFFFSLGAAVTTATNGNNAVAGYVAKSDASADQSTNYPSFILLSASGQSLDSQNTTSPYPEYKTWGTLPYIYYGNYATSYNPEKIISRTDGYILAINLPSAGPNGIMLFKVDIKGNVIWNHEYFGLSSAQMNSISNNAAGGLLISGGTTDVSGISNIWLLNTDVNGNKLWENNIPLNGFNAWAAGAVATGNSFAVGVNLISTNKNHEGFFGLLNIDQNGKIVEITK